MGKDIGSHFIGLVTQNIQVSAAGVLNLYNNGN